MNLPTHPGRALEAAAHAAARLHRAHPPKFYDELRDGWAVLNRTHARALDDLDVELARLPPLSVAGDGSPLPHGADVPPSRVLLVLRQGETEALARAWLAVLRSRGVDVEDRRRALAAMASFVTHAARSGCRGCPLTGPVTTPLIREWRRRSA